MLVDAAAAGLKPGEFWELSIPEICLYVRGVRRRRDEEDDRMISTAWHVAAFISQAGKLKPLSHYLSRRGHRGSLPGPDELADKIDVTFQAMMAHGGQGERG